MMVMSGGKVTHAEFCTWSWVLRGGDAMMGMVGSRNAEFLCQSACGKRHPTELTHEFASASP